MNRQIFCLISGSCMLLAPFLLHADLLYTFIFIALGVSTIVLTMMNAYEKALRIVSVLDMVFILFLIIVVLFNMSNSAGQIGFYNSDAWAFGIIFCGSVLGCAAVFCLDRPDAKAQVI